MRTFHLHISGQIEGVGVMPYLHRVALNHGLKGWLQKRIDGIHLEFNWEIFPELFVRRTLDHIPSQSKIHQHELLEVRNELYEDFEIKPEFLDGEEQLFITADLALCDDCRRELREKHHSRFEYPFITCTHCGPRYSVINELPYGREHTEMAPFHMCENCESEVKDPMNRRYFSQSNSCPACGVKMTVYADGAPIEDRQKECLPLIGAALQAGKLVAVKSTAGYHLLADATNEDALNALRSRISRPAKRLNLLYANMSMVSKDFQLSDQEFSALKSPVGPVVQLRKRKNTHLHVNWKLIAPEQSMFGVVLPDSPILYLIARKAGVPLAIVGAKTAGAYLIHQDAEAIRGLRKIADLILIHDREIVTPQEDTVVQYAADQRIIHRRGRGLAPSYFGHDHSVDIPHGWLALGAQLRSAFALSNHHHITVSQYLGDLNHLDTRMTYQQNLNHLQKLFQFKPVRIFTDKHPEFFTHELSFQFRRSCTIHFIQHHQAHFGAILMEHQLLETSDPVLGVIWDNGGYGDDGRMWGGEFFTYQAGVMSRVAHLKEQPLLFGEAITQEPRLSALTLSLGLGKIPSEVEQKFTHMPLTFYTRQLHQSDQRCTCMTQLINGVASIIGLLDVETYHGQAFELLENAALKFKGHTTPYTVHLHHGTVDDQVVVARIVGDLHHGIPVEEIAYKFYLTLVEMIHQVARFQGLKRIAMSGSIFESALLVTLVKEKLGEKYQLYFHQNLPPNDENIAFGQLACGYIELVKNQVQQEQLTEEMAM